MRSLAKEQTAVAESTMVKDQERITSAMAITQSEAIGSYLIAGSMSGNQEILREIKDVIADTLGRLYGYFNAPIPNLAPDGNPMLYLKDIALGFIKDFPEMSILDWGLFYDKVKKRTLEISADPYGEEKQPGTGTLTLHSGTVYGNLSPAQIAEWLHIYCDWRVAEREKLLREEQIATMDNLRELGDVDKLCAFLNNMVVLEDGKTKSILAFQPLFAKQCEDLIAIGGIAAARKLWKHAENQGRSDIMEWLKEYMEKNPPKT